MSVIVYSFSDDKTVTTDKCKNEEQKTETTNKPDTNFFKNEIKDQLSATNRTEYKTDYNQGKQEKPVIPGLGVYSDSSDSEASDE